MSEQNKKNDGSLFDKDPFPKDVWEIAYKNTGGKPFEKGNAFSPANETAKSATQSTSSKLTPEQQRLKSELKAKAEERKASGQTKSKPMQSYNTTFISGVSNSTKTSVTPPSSSDFYGNKATPSLHNTGTKPIYEPEEEEDEQIEDFEDLITKLIKKPFKEIEKALAGEEFDKPSVAIAAVVIILAIIVFGLLGS